MNKKVVLVTGASHGIGRATIIKFAKNNYNVVINYLNSESSAIELKKYLKNNYQIEPLLIKADISKEEEVDNMFKEIDNHFHRLDVVVNNAGIAIDTTVKDKKIIDFKRILEVNLIGPFIVSRAATKYMNEGNIINITSTNGIDTYYSYSLDYDASKAGLISLTHNLANYYSPKIRVNAVACGWVETDMNKEMSLEYKEQEAQKILLNRFANPDEIANVVYFLASDEASYINNSIIRVDGGKRE